MENVTKGEIEFRLGKWARKAEKPSMHNASGLHDLFKA